MGKILSIFSSITIALTALFSAITALPERIFPNMRNGNSIKYSIAKTEYDPSSPLKGKTIIFLGSSVTYGSASFGESFADYLEKKDGITGIKEAVSGTTLADLKSNSYISRMKTIDSGIKADAFICQLSTNDATKEIPLGVIKGGNSLDDFDTATVAGAIEYIICYARQTWKCPVIFYTGTKYDSEQYGKMVELLLEISKVHDIGVIDLWNDEELNSISETDYNFYMANGIHPKRAGYKLWWLPEFEEYLSDNI